MTPAGRIAAAIEVLEDIETRHRPVSVALRDWGVSHRFAGSKDRAAIGNIVYDTLRHRATGAFAMGSDSPRALVLATVGQIWGLGSEGLNQTFSNDRHAPENLSEIESAAVDAADRDGMPDYIKAEVPEWLVPSLQRVFGPDWVREGQALTGRPPLDLRVNTLKADREKVERALTRQGAKQTPHAPTGLRIAPTDGDRRHPNVQVEPGFQKGWFEIQDEGSQVAALSVGVGPGDQVLDMCAGGGGKTLALAAAMENKGQVIATDNDRSRLAPIFDRLKRAGTRNVQVRPAGGDLAELKGRMDAVMVDAPCTGTGTWRRRPDAKWRLRKPMLRERMAEQTGLLNEASSFVKPGGRLVYVTCSVLPEENDDRIGEFLDGDPDFKSVDPAAVIERALGEAGASRIAGAWLGTGNGFMLTPNLTGTDGFYVAAIERRS